MTSFNIKEIASFVEETILTLDLDVSNKESLIETLYECLQTQCSISKIQLSIIVAAILSKLPKNAPVQQEAVVPATVAITEPKWVKNKDELLSSGNVSFMYGMDISNKHAKNFSKDFNPETILKFQDSRDPLDRNFYEYILPNKPVKLFYDIEFYEQYNSETLDSIQHTVIQTSIKALHDMYNVSNIQTSDFAILDSSGQIFDKPDKTFKTSIHIVLTSKVCFDDMKNMKSFFKTVFSKNNKYLPQDVIDDLNIDGGVYGYGCLRMPGSTKKGQNRHLVITTGHEMIDCLIMNVDADKFQILGEAKQQPNKRQKASKKVTFPVSKLYDPNPCIQQMIDTKHPFLLHIADTGNDEWKEYMMFLHRGSVDNDKLVQISKLCPAKFDSEAPSRINSFDDQYKSYTCNCKVKYLLDNIVDLDNLDDIIEHYNYANSKDFEILKNSNRLSKCEELAKSKYSNEIFENFAMHYKDYIRFDDGMFFVFDKHWKEDKYFTFINRLLTGEYWEMYSDKFSQLCGQLCDTDIDEEAGEQITQEAKIYSAVMEKLQNGLAGCAGFKSLLSTKNECIGFSKLFDVDTNYIGFNNGVYDLKEKCFKPHSMDILITKSVGYDFPTECTYRSEINQFFKEVFPDREVRDYMKIFLASTIAGQNKDDLFFFWTGEDNKQTGANGKSTLCNLMKYTLGDYYLAANPAVITTDRGSSKSADPALLQFKSKRFITFQEIEGVVNMKKIKQYTGSDDIEARDLFKSVENFSPTWNLVTCCNTIPDLSEYDGGVTRRVRKIPFESKFVSDIDDEQFEGMQNVFQKNTSLKDEIKNWKSSLMLMLIHWYHEYYEPDTDVLDYANTPDKIKEATGKIFALEHDELEEFLDSHVRPHPDDDMKQYVKFTDIKQQVIMNVGKKYKQKELYEFLRTKYKAYYVKDYDDKSVSGFRQQLTNVIKGHILVF